MRTADIIINRWQTMEIFEDVHEIAPQFAQNDILDLADEIVRLRAKLAAAEKIFNHFGGLSELMKWENGQGETAVDLIGDYLKL